MTIIAFTPKFYDPKPFTSAPKKQAPQTSKPIILSNPIYRGIFSLNFHNLNEFRICKKEYTDVLDRIADFTQKNADKINPKLSRQNVDNISGHINELRNHVSNPNIDFFGEHKEIIYGPGKELFHELDDLLQNEQIPVQKRMNAVAMMAPSLGLCSGGVLTAVQEAVSSLKHATTGVKGAAYRTKIQMMDSLILQHVNENHRGYHPGNEVHFVNAYFNYIAKDMGVPERGDRFTTIAEGDITTPQLEKCREHVLTKLNPNALIKVMANNYLDQVKGAQRVDVSQALSGDNLTDVFRRSNDIKLATLNHEFGEVPDSSYLQPIEDTGSYQFSRQPTLLAKHFMETLREERIVNYSDAVTLVRDRENGDINILGDFLWRDREGECEELKASELLATSAKNISKSLTAARVSPEEQSAIFSSIAQHLLDSKEVDHIRAVPDRWLSQFGDLFEKGFISHSDIGPVVQLAAQFGCPATLCSVIRKRGDIDSQDAQGYTPLLRAAENGRPSAIFLLAEAGADRHRTSPQGDTSLMLCARQGHAQALHTLLRSGATHINAQNLQGYTATMLAAKEGHVGPLISLVDAKADLKLRGPGGHTALDYARQAGHVTCAQILEGSVPARQGDTVLMGCARDGYEDAVSALIQQGADVNAQDSRGMTALMMAAQGGHTGVMRLLLLAEAKPNLQAKDGFTATIHAALNGKAPAVQLLASQGANINLPCAGGYNTVMAAASAGSMDALIALMGAKANLTQTNDQGQTAAMIARQAGHVAVAQVLEAATQPPQQGDTALLASTRKGHTETVRALAQLEGMRLNAQDARGMSAVMVAAAHGRLDTLIALLDAQPDLTLVNKRGQTALDLAKHRRGNATAVAILSAAAQAQRQGQTPLMACASQGHAQAAQALIQHSKVGIDAQNQNGMTALMMAAQSNHPSVLTALLRGGASADRQDCRGMTAMAHAAQRGHTEAVNALIAGGANVHVASQGGNTPIMLAAAEGHIGTLTALINAKGGLWAKNDRHQNARIIASSNGHHAAVSLLETAMSEEYAGAFDSHFSVNRAALRQIGWSADDIESLVARFSGLNSGNR